MSGLERILEHELPDLGLRLGMLGQVAGEAPNWVAIVVSQSGSFVSPKAVGTPEAALRSAVKASGLELETAPPAPRIRLRERG